MPERVESFSITILGSELPDDQTERLRTSRWEVLCVGVQAWLSGCVLCLKRTNCIDQVQVLYYLLD